MNEQGENTGASSFSSTRWCPQSLRVGRPRGALTPSTHTPSRVFAASAAGRSQAGSPPTCRQGWGWKAAPFWSERSCWKDLGVVRPAGRNRWPSHLFTPKGISVSARVSGGALVALQPALESRCSLGKKVQGTVICWTVVLSSGSRGGRRHLG